MTLEATEDMTNIVTDNYAEVRHEYFGAPDDSGVRRGTVDVWYAVRPSAPVIRFVDNKDDLIKGAPTAEFNTGWTLFKAGADSIYIFDRDDINGMRKLLDTLEADMDRRDMEDLMGDFQAPEESEDNDD